MQRTFLFIQATLSVALPSPSPESVSKLDMRRNNARALEQYHHAKLSTPMNAARPAYQQRSAMSILTESLARGGVSAMSPSNLSMHSHTSAICSDRDTLPYVAIEILPRRNYAPSNISPVLSPREHRNVSVAAETSTLPAMDEDSTAFIDEEFMPREFNLADSYGHAFTAFAEAPLPSSESDGPAVDPVSTATGHDSVVEPTDLELATITVPTRQLFAYIFLLQALPISRLYLPPLTASALRWLDGSQWTVVATVLSCLGSSHDSGGGNDGGIGVYATLLPLLLLFGLAALSAAVLWVPTVTTGSSSPTSISDDEDGVSSGVGLLKSPVVGSEPSGLSLEARAQASVLAKTTVYFENETMRARALTILLQLQWALVQILSYTICVALGLLLDIIIIIYNYNIHKRYSISPCQVFPFSLQLARLCDCDSVDDIFYWRSDSNVECFVSGHLKAFLVILTLSFVWLIAVAFQVRIPRGVKRIDIHTQLACFFLNTIFFQIAAATNWRGVLPPIQFRARLGHLTDAYFDEWYLFGMMHIYSVT